jgi:hypothetical protein
MGLLQNILGSNLLQTVKGLVDSFHTSPELKAQMQAAIDENQTQIQLAQIALESKAQDTLARETEAAGANIRAEAASGDKYTSRARPSVIYVVLVILSANYIVFPLVGKSALVLPDALFWLFGSVVLGYTGARSWDKFTMLGKDK